MIDLLVVVGARPNFMKAASVVREAKRAGLDCALLDTGQHYDPTLSSIFFEELDLPRPDVSLGVGSASHAQQTARIMSAFETELLRLKPATLVVVGDVNSTLACALVAAKEGVPVAHVEAGLRCYDHRMAEEINRRLCDHLSTYLFTTSADADENLRREGIDEERIVLVGNTMIDTLLRFREAAVARDVPSRFGVDDHGYALLTLHRAENVDDPESLARILEAMSIVNRVVPVVFPMHPRTKARIETFRLSQLVEDLRVCEPLSYLDFVGLSSAARLVLTDSGGVQEETTVLGTPCLTLRESTERPVTVTSGTNKVIGTDCERIVEETLRVLEGPKRPALLPELWDGRAGERILAHLERELYSLPAAQSA